MRCGFYCTLPDTTWDLLISGLRPGDRFLFGGKTLELMRVSEMKAFVRKAKDRPILPRAIPWQATSTLR